MTAYSSVLARARGASPALLVWAAVLLSFFLALGRAPLFDVDEGAFSQATLEMFQRRDFVATYLNGEPRYDKPILIYWLQAASVSVLGVSELAFRLPSAICALVWAALTALFARRYFGRETALFSAGFMATSLGVYIIGRAATADALLNMLIAASMFAVWLHLQSGKRIWLYAAYAAIGLGFLTKGPVALLVPLAVSFLFCLLRRSFKTWLRLVLDPLGLLLFAVIALPWYALILQREGWAFVEGFFLKHNVSRFSGPLQGHAGGLLYYFPIVLVGTLPFTGLLAPLMLRLRSIWQDDLQCYLLIWFGFVFVFFSLSGTKLPHYVLYGMTGVYILMAVYATTLRTTAWALAPGLLLFVVLLALPGIVSLAQPRIADAYYREALSDISVYFDAGYYAFAVAAVLITLWLMIERNFALPRKLIAVGLMAVVGLSAFVVPVGAAVQQQPVKEAAMLSRERGYDVIMWRLNAPSFSVYYGRPTPSREPRAGDIVITKTKRLKELTGLTYQTLYAKHGIALVRIQP